MIKYLDKKYIIYQENVYKYETDRTKLSFPLILIRDQEQRSQIREKFGVSNTHAASTTHKVISKSSTCNILRCMP